MYNRMTNNIYIYIFKTVQCAELRKKADFMKWYS